MPSPTICDAHQESLRLQLLLQLRTPGDRFYTLSEDQWSTERYEQAASDHINKFQHQFQDPGTGHCHDRPVEELVANYQSHGLVEAKSYATSSIKAIYGSAPQATYRSALITPAEPCPSLESDHSSDGGEAANDPLAPRYASATPAASTRPSRQHEPSIFSSIQQVLSANPSFAEGVISAVNKLPQDKRNLLFAPETECVDGSSSRPAQSSERPSKKRRKSGNKSNKSGGNGSSDPSGGSGGAAGGSGDGDGEGRGGSEGGDGTPSDRKRNKDKQRRLICPYCLAYPEIVGIVLFNHCSPGNMTEVHLWRCHLEKYHSPKARNADPNAEENASFYMEPDQWATVEDTIKSYNERPRETSIWIAYRKALFLNVWRIIFPKDRFSHLNEPVSPFHFDRDEYMNLERNLGQKAELLVVGPLMDTLADKANASRDDFQPTTKQWKEIISAAIAIILRDSPAATGATQTFARAPAETIKASREHYKSEFMPPSKADVAHPYGVPAGPDDDRPATRSRSATAPGTPEHIPSGSNVVQAVPPGFPVAATVLVPLYPTGTQVVLSPINQMFQIDTQVGQLTLPPTFFPSSIIEIAPPSVPPMITTPGTPVNVPQQTMYYTQGTGGPPPEEPGISLQTIQGKPSNQEEWVLQEQHGPTMM
ncbi:hypothetical protein ACHAPJ_010117 [Fusarium lateritium]